MEVSLPTPFAIFNGPPVMPGLILPVQPCLIQRQRRRKLPAVWMRAGTSKGLFIHKHDLPAQQEKWGSIISRAMGSYDADPRQLDGVGGATSTTSKAAIVARSTRPGVDIEYTFAQIPIGGPGLDFSGNCGNIASGVGPFALDEGLVPVRPGQKEVDIRILNTNTGSVLVSTVQVNDAGGFQEDGDYTIPGVSAKGSEVQMAFVNPGGPMTGKLLPSGSATDTLTVQSSLLSVPCEVRVSVVDSANPFVFVDSSTIPDIYHQLGPHNAGYLDFMESIRRKGAVLMGLASSEATAALTRGTPKIAVVQQPLPSRLGLESPMPDIQVAALSMGKVHGSLQLTGAVCLASAMCTPGTLPHAIAQATGKPMHRMQRTRSLTIRHSGGDMKVKVELGVAKEISKVVVSRTARTLFQGNVCYLS